MAFTKSTVTTNNISALPDKPLITAAALKQKFDQYGADDKTYVNSLIDQLELTTGTSGAENIGSKTISGISGNTPHAQITDVKAQLDARNAENVKLTGNQTISGTKTFSSSPVVPTPTTDMQTSTKKYVDDENLKDVHLTDNQTISGIKTFSSSPIVPTPTTATQASNKSYIDGVASSFTLGAIPDASLSYDKQNSESKLTVEKQSFKNKIINGNFDIWQRGTTQTTTTYGSCDRWSHGFVGSTNVITRGIFTIGQTEVPDNPKYYWRNTVVAGAGTSDLVQSQQKIESVLTFSGIQCTLSFYAKADSTKNIYIDFVQNFGTGGSPSSNVITPGQKIAISSSWSKYTITVTIPSVSGKTFGTNLNDFLACNFFFDAGSDLNARTQSLGHQSGVFDIAQIQFEQGSVATKFEQRHIRTELELCQRYYEKSFQIETAPIQNVGTSVGALVATGQVTNQRFGAYCNFKTTKRATPVVTTFAPDSATANWSNNTTTPTATLSQQSQTGFYVDGTTSVTAGNNYAIHWTADIEL